MRLHTPMTGDASRPRVLALSLLALAIAGCPNSPLADLLAGKTGGSTQTPVETPVLPRPTVLSATLTQGVVRVEWTVSSDQADSVFGYTAFRSEESDRGFTAQRSFARSDDLIYLDGAIQGGTTYYYHVVSVDQLGNLSDPSDTVSIEVPLRADQVIAYADTKTGTFNTARGVYDLNAAESDILSFASHVDGVGVKWWGASVGRWDAGATPSNADILNREYFTGHTLADAQDPSFYHWNYLDSVILNALSTGATPIVSLDVMPGSLAANTQVLYRAPIWSWSDNVRNSPPSDPAVFAEVVKRVIMHYTQGWGGGRTLNLPCWELWHAPDIDSTFGPAAGISWTGTPEQFASLYVVVHQAVKAQFGSAIKFGGAAFADPASIGPFLDAVVAAATPDFISFSVSNDAPTEVGRVAQIAREAIIARGLTQTETIASGFNLALPLPGVSPDAAFVTPDPKFNSVLHAIHYFGSYQLLMDASTKIVLHDGLRDRATGFNPGLIGLTGEDKPVSVLSGALKVFDTDRNRVRVAPAGALAMAGLNDAGTEFSLFLVNAAGTTVTNSLEVRKLPWQETDTFNWSLKVLTDDTFAATKGFGGLLGGSVRGRALTLQPALPPSSILQLTVTLQPAS